ncbi:class III signal peptide-containing protein [bacterium]|nr:class III signal peptide-containing protein [bacterium]
MFKMLRKSKKGQSAIEYAVILGVMAAAAIVIINIMRAGIEKGYTGIANSIGSFAGEEEE